MIKKIENFIGIFDSVLSPAECSKIIYCFENMKQLGFTRSRQDFNDCLPHQKDDESSTLYDENYIVLPGTNAVVTTAIDKIWECYKEYCDVYSMLQSKEKVGIVGFRVQKTSPGQGYHVWHYENPGRFFASRQIAFQIYLNTVDEGGETEFLYYPKRITPIEGRLLLWPAGFTHTHRGNQPLSGDKYVITGWIEAMS